MDQNIAILQGISDEVVAFLKVRSHFVGGNVESIDYFMIHAHFFGVADSQHGRSCQDYR